MEVENIDSPITLSVNAPFEISTDKSDWSQSLTLQPMEDRFYIRVNADAPGNYETFITASAGDYTADDAMVDAIVTDPSVPTFIETFEPNSEGDDSYSKHTYFGSASTWNCDDAGIWDSDKGYNGNRSLRLGKNSTSSITTASAKPNGIGSISFFAKRFSSSDAEAGIEVEYSPDGGQTWVNAGTAEVTGTTYQEFKFIVNVTGNNLIRLRQTSGKRVNIDDITVTDFIKQAGIADIADDIQTWDAYSIGGQLVIENHNGEAMRFIVYNLEGMILADRTVCTSATIDLTPGFYIISNLRDIRRVVVK